MAPGPNEAWGYHRGRHGNGEGRGPRASHRESQSPPQMGHISREGPAFEGCNAPDSVTLRAPPQFDKLPKDLLLVLKANNLLRFVNDLLGSPVNRFLPIKEFAERGLRAGGARAGAGAGTLAEAGWLGGVRAWVGLQLYPAAIRLGRALAWAQRRRGPAGGAEAAVPSPGRQS